MSDPTNPPPSNPYGEQPGQQPGQQPPPYGQPSYGQEPYGQQQPAYGQPSYGAYGGDSDKRPGTVTAASIITIIFSALGLITFAILAAVVQASEGLADDINEEMEGQAGLEDFSAEELIDVLTVVFSVFALWCLVALVLGVLAMRRQNWARILVVVSAAISGLISLVGIGSGVSAITLIASIAAIVLYFTGGANDWYSRKGRQQT